MSALTAFNNQLDNFVCYLEKLFPDKMNIKTYHNSISLLRKVNPRKLVEMYKEHVYNKYSVQIMNKDANFFLENDFNDVLEGDNESMLEALSFKEMWKDSSTEIHDQIFRYFQLLCLLSEKC